jgi:hypothetical protein
MGWVYEPSSSERKDLEGAAQGTFQVIIVEFSGRDCETPRKEILLEKSVTRVTLVCVYSCR